jgi:hypothetical protein
LVGKVILVVVVVVIVLGPGFIFPCFPFLKIPAGDQTQAFTC